MMSACDFANFVVPKQSSARRIPPDLVWGSTTVTKYHRLAAALPRAGREPAPPELLEPLRARPPAELFDPPLRTTSTPELFEAPQ